MFPPVFQTAKNSPAVTALLQTGNILRVFLFDEAQQNTPYPYAVWQIIGGIPENYLGDLPDLDNFTTQIDVYANSAAEAWAAGKALRDSFEKVAYITSWRGTTRDQETKKYRLSFDVDWKTERT